MWFRLVDLTFAILSVVLGVAGAAAGGRLIRRVGPRAPAVVRAGLPAGEAHLRGAFEHALDALLVADDRRRVRDANPAACSLLGV
jgi:PAS domain-containing protein